MEERGAIVSEESLCQRLGDLIVLAVPTSSQVPDAWQWIQIESLLKQRSQSSSQ
jgi:hypothetical protein